MRLALRSVLLHGADGLRAAAGRAAPGVVFRAAPRLAGPLAGGFDPMVRSTAALPNGYGAPGISGTRSGAFAAAPISPLAFGEGLDAPAASVGAFAGGGGSPRSAGVVSDGFGSPLSTVNLASRIFVSHGLFTR
jgi:hypothetical protein